MRPIALALLLHVPLLAQVEAPAPLVVMNLAAHPDDEDGRTLTYYRHARNAVAYSVIFTRGEGGQNEIGPELYEQLGALRTEETERAARILGTQVFFLNYQDFGFSKAASEAFERWGGRDEVVARLVYMIRKLKPDVLFTNHDTVTVGPRRQHGHHQAVGLAGYEAFERAADPTYRPEQLEEPGVDLWQPKRLFLRFWSRPEEFDVRVPVGDVDPESGESHAERAGRALAEHASQGMDFLLANRWRSAQTAGTYFRLIRSASDAPLDSLDLAGNLPPNTTANPDLTYLLDAGRLREIPTDSVQVEQHITTPGQRVEMRWPASVLPAVSSLTFDFEAPEGSGVESFERDEASVRVVLRLSRTAPYTVPRARYQYERFESRPPIRYRMTDAETGKPLAGGYVPVEIAPAIVLDELPEVTLLRPGENRIRIAGTVYNRVTRCEYVQVSLLQVGSQEPMATRAAVPTISAENRFESELALDLPDDLAPGDYILHLDARGGKIERTEWDQPARVLDVDVAPGLRVGVIESYDGTLTAALRVLGVEPVLLDSTMLASGDLSTLHTILVDIRAYFVRRDLRTYNSRLLHWVEEGGHLVVNYQKTFEWNAGFDDPFDVTRTNPGDFAPYPLVLGGRRVTLEDAPVTLLAPDLPLFHTPNKIRPEDWDGWVQERGLYFPDTYDDRYTELFSLADPGEAAERGSTLWATYGKGTYVYTALAWYRQLKRFHPGAFRFFANLISLPLVR